jgi:hypothetical protein
MALAKTMPRIVDGGCRVWMVIVNGESAAETPLILSAQCGLVYVGRGPRRQRTGSPWQYNDWRLCRAFVPLSKSCMGWMQGLHSMGHVGPVCTMLLQEALPDYPSLPHTLHALRHVHVDTILLLPPHPRTQKHIAIPSPSSRSLHASLMSHVISL